ncbi:MAG: response regulator [Anaerolineae bacterium]|nr:response regulator [Anaerolineae bacterium]
MNTVNYSQTMAADAILVIDDNTAMREALTDILSLLLGIPVYTAANGHEGLQIYQQQNIALVLLDMNMPVMNGEQTYEKLQQIAPQVKVIVSSSLSRAEASHRFGERKLPTFLRKPYDTERLLAVVQTELLSVPAANQSGSFVSQSQNGKNGAGHGRQPTEKEFNLMVWADDGGPTA